MMTRCVLRRWLAVAASALTLAFAGAAGAAFELADTSWEGCSELLGMARELLGTERVILTATLDWRALTSNDAVLLVHPTSPLDPDEAAAFMKAGGRLGVIDDYGRGDRLLEHFKLARRALPLHPSQVIRGNSALPVATPAYEPGAAQGLGVHPTVVDVSLVVLNHATGFDHPNLTPVLEVRGSRDVSGGEPDAVAVAVAGQVDKGRLFAVGDPSAFINLMLRYPGNRAFAKGVLRYLGDGDANQPRRGRLYVLVNDFDEARSFGGETPLRTAIERALRTMGAGLRELNANGLPWWLHTVAAAFCALAVFAWAVRAPMKLYAARLPRFAREVPLAGQGGIGGRLAVLAAPGTAPELALLELRQALVESLAAQLDKPDSTPLDALLQGLRASGELDEPTFTRASRIAETMREAETTVVRGARSKVRRAQLLDAARLVEELLGRTIT